jgi:2-hydroxy-3-oxopropionate reductase
MRYMKHVGFIGLGIMGKPMAGNLLKAGYALSVYNRSEGSVTELKRLGATGCRNPKEVAENSEVVILMLPDTPDVEEVIFGNNGVSDGAKPGSIVVDMSSISPVAARQFAEKLGRQGVEMLDAPVSGGQIGAQNATLSIMAGGKADVFEKVKPLFEKMGKNIVLIGGYGDGQVCKVANQVVVALTIEAIGEALLLAAKAGTDVMKVREALLGGFAQSRILEVHGERMIKRAFQPGFKIKLHKKDLDIALKTGRDLGVSLPNTATTQELFTAAAAYGGIDLDHSAMVQALEKLANFAIGDKAP